jgi:fructokinase
MGRIGVSGGRLVSWGEVLWDLFPEGPRLGGAPANVAYHLAALGADVALISRVGDDARGRAAVAQLAAAGVDVSGVQVHRARPTGAVGVELVAGEARYSFHPDCAWEHIEWDDRGRALVTGASAICFGTLCMRRAEARSALGAGLAAARRAGEVLAVCDLNLRPAEVDADLVRWALDTADVVKLNEREAGALARLSGRSDGIRWLTDELSARAVAVTRGAGGCRIAAGAAEAEHGGFPCEAGGDTVGCGDAFTAVLALGLVRGAPIEAIAAAACRYAAFVAGQRGAMPAVPPALAEEVSGALGG